MTGDWSLKTKILDSVNGRAGHPTTTDSKQAKPFVCCKYGQEGHFANRCASEVKLKKTGKQKRLKGPGTL